MSNQELESRIARLEGAVVALSDNIDAPTPPVVEEIKTDIDNTPNAEGHSPKMIRDWLAMCQRLVDEQGVASLDAAGLLLVDFFGKIERGELKPDGSPLGS